MKNRISSLLSSLLPIAVFFASFGLYVSTLAPGMLRGDSGEFQWAMASLNVPHATGYPLFTLIGYAWEQMPLAGASAWRLNLISAIFGAGAVTLLFLLSRLIVKRSDAALIAAIFFALAPVFWFNASILEVYTLNAFLLALIVYLFVRWSVHPASGGPLYLAFLALGLALAHHRMIVLALPGLAVFVILTDRRFFLNWKRLLLFALLLLPGLALYIYVPIRLLAAGESLHYALFDIILGQEFAASLFREYNLAQVLWEIPVQNFNVGLAISALGLIVLFRNNKPLALMTVLIYVADAAFALAYWVPDVQVFLTPSFVIIGLWIAVGCGWLIGRLESFVRPPWAMPASTLTALLLIVLASAGFRQYPAIIEQVKAEAGTSEPRARAIIASGLPVGSMLELDWETATAVRFIQTTEGTRSDLEARLIKIDERDEYNSILKNVDTGRPVFVESGVNWTRAAAGYFLLDAPAQLVQVIRGPVQALAVSVNVDDQVRLAAMRDDDRGLVLYWLVRKPLQKDLATFVHFFDADGQPIGQEDHAPCCQATFGYRTTEWQTGQEMADSFRPAPPRTTYLQIGMYSVENGDVEPYGQTVALQTAPVGVGQTARPLDVQLGQVITARAFELSKGENALNLTLFWQAISSPPKDYTVFIHSLDSSGKILNQADRQPLGGVYPTGSWKAGQIVRDTFRLPELPGQVNVEFGLYDPATGQRLARSDGKGDAIVVQVP